MELTKEQRQEMILALMNGLTEDEVQETLKKREPAAKFSLLKELLHEENISLPDVILKAYLQELSCSDRVEMYVCQGEDDFTAFIYVPEREATEKARTHFLHYFTQSLLETDMQSKAWIIRERKTYGLHLSRILTPRLECMSKFYPLAGD